MKISGGSFTRFEEICRWCLGRQGRGLRWENLRNVGVGTGPESDPWRSTGQGERLGLTGGFCRLRGWEGNHKTFAAHSAPYTGRFIPREWGRVETVIFSAVGAFQDHIGITPLANHLHHAE